MLNRQMSMLNRVLDFMINRNEGPRVYEDEIPSNNLIVPGEDV